MNFRIWWLNEDDCRAIGDRLHRGGPIPGYLQAQYSYRRGRSGRGRLWAHDQFEVPAITWPETPLAQVLEAHYGGIVIRKCHAPLVSQLPGIVTDFELRRVL